MVVNMDRVRLFESIPSMGQEIIDKLYDCVPRALPGIILAILYEAYDVCIKRGVKPHSNGQLWVDRINTAIDDIYPYSENSFEYTFKIMDEYMQAGYYLHVSIAARTNGMYNVSFELIPPYETPHIILNETDSSSTITYNIPTTV